MKSNRSEYQAVFKDAVSKTFGILAEEYKIPLQQTDAQTFKLSLKDGYIKVHLSFGHLPVVNVLISPTKTEEKELDFLEIGILNFVKYKKPDTAFIDLSVSRPKDISPKVEMLATLLREYCASFLAGDFSLWPEVAAFVEKSP